MMSNAHVSDDHAHVLWISDSQFIEVVPQPASGQPMSELINRQPTAPAGSTRFVRSVFWLNARLEAFCRLVVNSMTSAPWRLRGVIGSVLLVAITLALTAQVHAGVILDGILGEFTGAGGAGAWMANALTLANALFTVIAIVVIAYNIVSFYITYDSMHGMLLVIVRTCLSLGVPWLMITSFAPLVLTNIIGTAGQLSGKITGNAGFANTTPDTLWLVGVKIGGNLMQHAFGIFKASHFTISLDPAKLGDALAFDAFQMVADVMFIVFALVLMIVTIAAFVFIAVELLLAQIQAIFSLPLGVWALGFSAAPATAGIASGVWSGILQTLVRYIAILAGASFAQTVGNTWVNGLNNVVANWNRLTATGTVDVGAFKTMISYTLGALALLYIVRQLPQLAMAALSGAPVFSGANLVHQTAGIAASGASLAMGAPGAAWNAGMAGMQRGMVASGAMKGWSAANNYTQSTQGRDATTAEKVGGALGSAAAQAQRARQIRNLLK